MLSNATLSPQNFLVMQMLQHESPVHESKYPLEDSDLFKSYDNF